VEGRAVIVGEGDTMRKRILIGLAVLWGLCFAGLLLADFLHLRKPGVTVENFQRLHGGMTGRQVVRILGRPPDVASPIPGGYEARWETDDGTLWIFFSPTAVSGALSMEGVPILQLRRKPPSLHQRVKQLLGTT
jgi:hypothetical protein